MSKPKRTRSGAVALVGRPNVGKSTLLNALVGEPLAIVSHHPQTTRQSLSAIVTRGPSQFVFVDTPGIHAPRHQLGDRMNGAAEVSVRDADVVVLVVEADPAHMAPREDDMALLERFASAQPVLLVLNKIDCIEPKSLLIGLLEALAAAHPFAALIPISASHADGVERVLEEVEKLLPSGPWLYPHDELTDKPVRFFVSEFLREQVLRRTRQEVPHGVAVSVEAFEETESLVRIAVTIHVAKESHKGILIGGGGAMLKSIGTGARKRVEHLMGKKVHLETRIRTTPGWFDDPARLDELGFAADSPTRSRKGLT